jgi:hypothetical protein
VFGGPVGKSTTMLTNGPSSTVEVRHRTAGS